MIGVFKNSKLGFNNDNNTFDKNKQIKLLQLVVSVFV